MPEAEETVEGKLFCYLIGETGRELCETLMSDVTDGHCNPMVNETVVSNRFFMNNEGQDENTDTHVTDLRMWTCNFGQIRDSLIRDRIVCGIIGSGPRERLLREDNLTLDK